MTDPVDGTLLVTASSQPSGRSMYTNYRLHGVVTAAGLPATPIDHIGYARNTKWPFPGASLPVLVDRADPRRLRIRWDRVPTGEQTAARQTDRLAQFLRGQAAPNPAEDVSANADRIAAAMRESLLKMGLFPGEAASAVVTASREVPTPLGEVAPGGTVELTLEVTRANGVRYSVRVPVFFSSVERRLRFGVVGAHLPVRVNPADPSHVVIDTAALGLSDPL